MIKNIFNFCSISLISLLTVSVSYAGVTSAVPTTALSKIAKSTSYTSNSTSQTATTSNTTTSVINTNKLKETIAKDAKKFGLKVDEAALELLSGGIDSSNISKVLAKASENVNTEMYDYDYIPEKGPDTYVYQFGTEDNWIKLEQVTEYDGKSYSNTQNAFDGTVDQYSRADVYVDFTKKQIYADVFTKLKAKTKDLVEGTRITGVAAITQQPVIAIDTHAVVTTVGTHSGNVDGPDFNDNPDTIQASSTQLHNNPYNGDAGTMKWYNHNTTDANAEFRFFFSGKFTTATAGADGSAIIGIEAANCNACTEEQFIATIERYQASGTISPKKAGN